MFTLKLSKVLFFCLLLLSIKLHAENQSQSGYQMSFDFRKQSDEFWKKNLKPEVYNICRMKGTEPAFSGTYDKFYKEGIYYCACCGGDHPLFSSTAKFDSGTGWPSFWAPFDDKSVELHEESFFKRIFGPRIEVVCARCNAHLGHVFDDGPKEHTGKRYCMNSLALSFTPKGEVIPINTIIPSK